MVSFEPRRIGVKFYDEIETHVLSARSVVILGPRFGGKRHVLREVVRRVQAREIGPLGVLKGRAAEPLVSVDRLARSIAAALNFVPTTPSDASADQTNPFAAADWLHERTGKPVILFVENVDAMPHHMARVFLEGVRRRVEARSLTVLLTGEQDLRDLVHGPRSEFNCAQQFILQGYEKCEFAQTLAKFAAVLNLHYEPCPDSTGVRATESDTRSDDAAALEHVPDVPSYLHALSGGSTFLLRMALGMLVERRVRGGASDSTITVDVLKHMFIDDSLPATFWAQLPRHAVRLVSWEPDCWQDLECLLNETAPSPRASGAPGPLEFAGFAVRQDGRLHFASPLMREFARRYYTRRRLADLYARKGDWDEAFARYARLSKDDIVRPPDTEDRADVEAALRSLGATLHASIGLGVGRLKSLLVEGCRNLLGFDEVTFWIFDTRWQLDDHSKPDALFQEIPVRLPPVATPGWFPLPEPLGNFAIAATLKGPAAERPCAVVASNIRSRLVTSRERQRLGRELLQTFIEAHGHAIDIAANQARLTARNKHLEIVNTIIASIGSPDVNVLQLIVLASNGLRGLGYKRVLFCLVDPLRQRIVGVHDNSSDGVDLARMTDYPLHDPKVDIQPYVIRSRQWRIVPNAAAEPLASPNAVSSAKLQAFAIVPMLNREGEAIGTVHIERDDGVVPSTEEVEDLMLFGRQLATVIAHSERVELQRNALDRCPEPVLITDQFERVRYANGEAAILFGLESGWKEGQDARRLGEGVEKVRQALKKALRGTRSTDFVHGIGRQTDYRGTMFFDHVDDWRNKVVGSVLHIRDQNSLYHITEATVHIANAENASEALDRIVDASTSTLGFAGARLYLIAPDDERRMVGVRSRGLSPAHEAAFNEGQIELPSHDTCEISWRTLDEEWPVVFSWCKNADNEDQIVIRSAARPEEVIHKPPPLAAELEKRVGAYWIDVPLMTPKGAIGKLTLPCAEALQPDQYEALSFFGRQAGQLLAAFQQRDERDRWLAFIAHNLGSRLGPLSPLLKFYRDAEHGCPQVTRLNDLFESGLADIQQTAIRTTQLLSGIVVDKSTFDLHDLLESVLKKNLPPGVRTQSECPDPFQISADKYLLESALVELFQNSRQIVGDDGRLSIELRVERVDAPAGPYTEIDYQDNGPGVPPHLKQRIFELSFSERPGKMKSTGIGLAFVRRVIKAHDGTVEECGKYGNGVRFVIRLPLAALGAGAEVSQ